MGTRHAPPTALIPNPEACPHRSSPKEVTSGERLSERRPLRGLRSQCPKTPDWVYGITGMSRRPGDGPAGAVRAARAHFKPPSVPPALRPETVCRPCARLVDRQNERCPPLVDFVDGKDALINRPVQGNVIVRRPATEDLSQVVPGHAYNAVTRHRADVGERPLSPGSRRRLSPAHDRHFEVALGAAISR